MQRFASPYYHYFIAVAVPQPSITLSKSIVVAHKCFFALRRLRAILRGGSIALRRHLVFLPKGIIALRRLLAILRFTIPTKFLIIKRNAIPNPDTISNQLQKTNLLYPNRLLIL